LKLGLIGCGRIATAVHIPSLLTIDGISLEAVADNNKDRLESTVRKFKVQEGYLDYREMLKEADLDAVLICSPPSTHYEMIMESLRYGKHILCEKPLAETLQEALKIKEDHRRSDVLVMPAHNFIFTPAFIEAERLVMEGEIGKVKSISGCAISNLTFYGAKTDFRMQTRGGVIEDQLPHVIYTCNKIGGVLRGVESVEAFRRRHLHVDDVKVVADLERDVVAKMIAKWSGFLPFFKFEIIGESGSLHMDLLRAPYTLEIVRDGETKRITSKNSLLQYLDVLRNRHPSYYNEHLHFLKCVEEGEEMRATLNDGIELVRALSEIMTIYEKSEAPIQREEIVSVVSVGEDIKRALYRSIRLLGDFTIDAEAEVVIKPNVCFGKNPHDMVITDLRLLEAVINWAKERSKRVVIVESDNNAGPAEKRLESSGVMEVIENCGVEFLNLTKDDTLEFSVEGTTLHLPQAVLNAGFFINLPKIKTCNIEGVFISIAMKNLFGVIPQRKKARYHKMLEKVLLFLNKTIRQDLIVVDGIVGMEGLGPIWGRPVKLNLIVSGRNPVAVDSTCCRLMEINPFSVGLLWSAYKEGLGEIYPERIRVRGEDVKSLSVKFETPFLSKESLVGALKAFVDTYFRG